MKGRSCLGFFGIGWTAFTLFFTVAGITTHLEGDSIGIAMAVLFGVLTFGGLAMIYKGFKSIDVSGLSTRDKERFILEIAQRHHGEVTLEEVAVDTELTARECKEVLEGLASVGSCDTWIGRHGETIYVFRGFLRDGRAHRAFDPAKGDTELEFGDLEDAQAAQAAVEASKHK